MDLQKLLSQMTLEEKVGQLQQCGPSLVGAFDVSFSELLNMMFDGRISQEEFGRLMSTAKQDYHEDDIRAGLIGSFNGIEGAETTNRLQKIAVEESRLGIPLIFGLDVIHGYKSVVPIPLAEACAWEPTLWERTARMAAEEATAAGVHMTFAPMVDVAKDARWGRVSEGAGEDAMLSGLFGEAKVHGYQGDLKAEDGMAACVKHFAGYGAAEAGRDYNRVDMSPQRFFEEYLPPYEKSVKAGAMAIMPAFNDISGVPCSVNKWLLTDILRDQWGFTGMAISDANAIAECVNHGIAADRADAAAQALEAGMDMDMTSNCYIENIAELVRTGKVKEEYLDRAVLHILTLKEACGLFDNPYQTSEEHEAETVLNPKFRPLAREAAQKSIVLLKNDSNEDGKKLLPLAPGQKIGVIGYLAASRDDMLGAWAVSGTDSSCVCLNEGLNNRGVEYTYITGMKDDEVDTEGIRKLAAECDIILAAVGEHKNLSGEAASRASIDLPDKQKELLAVIKETGVPTIAVVFNGRPLAMPEADACTQAILEVWHLGIEAGNAICDVLYGDVNPSAKLTTTFPYTSGQCPMYYAHINTGRPGGRSKFTSKYLDTPLVPLYPFGYGLSYTSYEYAELKLAPQENAVKVSVAVTNTGDRAGEEIVQCYFGDPAAKRVRPVKKLVDFAKIALAAGEKKTVEFTIPYEKFGYYDMQMNYCVDDGKYIIYVGRSSADCLEESFVK